MCLISEHVQDGRDILKANLDAINGLRQKDKEAFQILYDENWSLVRFVIMSIIKNEEDCKDLMQDTFIKMYTNINDLTDSSKFTSWLCTIARNTAYNFLRSQSHYSEMDENFLDYYIDDTQQTNYFKDIALYLSDLETIIVTYKIVYDLGFKEISMLVGMPLSTVHVIYKKALLKVKAHYEKEETDK